MPNWKPTRGLTQDVHAHTLEIDAAMRQIRAQMRNLESSVDALKAAYDQKSWESVQIIIKWFQLYLGMES